MPMVDYTKLFATPDELVDFLMLEVKEQDSILAKLVQIRGAGGMKMYCRLERTDFPEVGQHHSEGDN